MRGFRRSQRGAASIEQAGLTALIALLIVGAVALLAAEGEIEPGRELGASIARKLACAPQLPDACRHHPLVPAYGWPVARLVRALAPAPRPRQSAAGLSLMPVDFRHCRRASCAGAAGPHLTASNRRVTVFTSLDDRRSRGWLRVEYWLYRPTLGWERLVRSATQADVAAASGTRVLAQDDPALVPLETLPGRDHYEFPPPEEPPWRWRVAGRFPGWSS